MKKPVFGGVFNILAAAVFNGCERLSRDLGANNSPVLAQVGSAKIPLDEYKARLQATPADYRQYLTTADGRREYLNLLMREKVLLAEAKRLGIPRDPAYIRAAEKIKNDAQRRVKEEGEALQVESAVRL